jgi:hypothetical protein
MVRIPGGVTLNVSICQIPQCEKSGLVETFSDNAEVSTSKYPLVTLIMTPRELWSRTRGGCTAGRRGG